ncbi:lytic transglycosylase [Phaeobacter sp.]|uniref:transglycosylase SLT domain-containing protein n=1 Tax=Phaeobacter sp. TaxID=1902409 RepID=UPI0025D290F6|nr:lytic transglycosylase [Phaeobacter sp.]
MIRVVGAMLMAVVVASCSGGGGSPPRDLDNACSIIKQRPQYLKAFRATERKWGVPMHVQMATIYQESRFRSNARTPHRFALGVIPLGRQSSAYGYSQALDGTWDDYRKGPGRRGAKRNRIKDATDFMGWYMNQTRERNGIRLTDARNQYLAYHEGHTGFARGSYRSKPWLIRVAGQVQARANLYQTQLATCRRARR